jgi:5-formyltetrahydrofolate cyclo-ligase
MDTVKAQKKKLRTKIKKRLEKLDIETVKDRSAKIRVLIKSTPAWNLADIILCFLSMGKEVDTTEIIETAISSNKLAALPRIIENKMIFHFVESCNMNWQIHPYGMREPSPALPVFGVNRWPDHNVLIVTPGLAFDEEGNRLGRGKGYYDRFLSSFTNPYDTIGVCFTEQLVEKVPMGYTDRKVNRIVTEKGIINTGNDIFKRADRIHLDSQKRE